MLKVSGKEKNLRNDKRGKRVKFCTGGKSVKGFVVFSSETLNARRQWNNIFRRQHWKKKKKKPYQSRIFYPPKNSFKRKMK